MPKEEEICKRLDVVTGGLSIQFRTLAIGLIAVCGGLLIGESKTSLFLPLWVRTRLIGVALGVIIAIAVDLFQLVMGYAVAITALRKLEKKKEEQQRKDPTLDLSNISAEYENKSWQNRLQMFAFWTKLGILAVLTIWIGLFMSYFLLHQKLPDH